MEIKEIFEEINALWEENKFEEVTQKCDKIISGKDSNEYERGYALLRKAHALEIMDKKDEAKDVYRWIVGSFTLPQSFRYEATLKLKEFDSTVKKSNNSERFIKDYVPKTEFYVSVKGNDNNPGTKEMPFATIKKAKDTVKSLDADKGTVCVYFEEGTYNIDQTVEFDAKDKGTRGCPVIYKGLGNVTFYGGKKVYDFKPVTDEEFLSRIPENSRGKVYEADLKSQGINDYGKLWVRGYHFNDSGETFEIYVNGKAQSLVRYPKEGFMDVDNLVSPGDIRTGEPSVFEYKDSEIEKWKCEDLWLFGYFHFLWADRTIKVSEIDKEKKQLIMKEAYHWTDEPNDLHGDGMLNEQGIKYYAFNMPEEISLLGEYYLDRTTGKIYIYPDCDLSKADVEVNIINGDMFTMENCDYIRFENIHFDMGRQKCFNIKNSKGIEIIGCSVSRFAGDGIMTENVSDMTVFGCEISTLGRGGILVNGGDRKTLTPANNLVENCKIHDFGRIDRTYTPAILLRGVGMKAAHNEMYNAPSSAMRVEGNEMIIEYNDFHDLCLESDDQGCVDVYFDFTYRNQFYRFNYIHHNGKGEMNHVAGQGALRFDDAISGMVVYGNVIEKSAKGGFGGIQINSGRDNVIDNNIFIDCDSAFSGGYHPDNSVWVDMRENRLPEFVQFNDFYMERYPEIKNVTDRQGINHYFRNILINCRNFFPDGYMVNATYVPNDFDQYRNMLWSYMLPENMLNEDYTLNEEIYKKLTFRQIPFGEIGVYESKYNHFEK